MENIALNSECANQNSGEELPRSLEEIVARASMRVRVSQTNWTAPVVLASLVAVDWALQDRVQGAALHLWACIMGIATLIRALLCVMLREKVATATREKLRVLETYLFASALLNAIAIGLSFWLVARNGDLTVKLVVTLISCFYGIGTLVNASSHFPSFVVVCSINLGQGVLFWLGVGSGTPPQLEVAIPFLAVSLLIIAFARSNSRQFAESLAIRTENVALLSQLAKEKELVERALAEAKHASESKSRFLAAASHDLRQPLHAMTMFLGTLTFHVSTDDARRLLGRIKETTVVLENQFNSLLDLSKFDAGAVEIDLDNFRIDDVVERVAEELRPQAESKELAISLITFPAIAYSDAALIERVLRNLLGNAIKYTVQGEITLRIVELEHEFQIEVSDTGPGIPQSQQTRIFQEYVQLDNPGRQRHRGVGLGLSIVSRINSLLDLQLTLQSTVGVGSTFKFRVARASSTVVSTSCADSSANVEQFFTDAEIWILDDDPLVVESLCGQLTAWGANVRAFSQPEGLLKTLRTSATLPAWILTDDMLGSALSGLDTARMLSSQYGFGKVCLITGNSDPARLAQLRASGFPIIVKPAQPESLMAVIRH